MEHGIRRAINNAVLPIHPHEIRIVFVPEQRVALAGYGEDADAVEMAVAFLEGPTRDFRGMRADGVVGQN